MIDTPHTYPILDEDSLLSMPKSQKPHDMERIMTSPNSEDWVTWNFMRALQRAPGHDWWSGVVAAAEADAGRSARWTVLEEPPTVELWRTVPSPPAYEAASRQRMATSENDEWRTRAENRRAFEGSTEVDLVFDGNDYLVFVEAKLHSDVSTSTTYDPDRNQIVRNIDCVIEEAGVRVPFFWMLVRDRSSERLYMQIFDGYRVDPSELHRLLPHRDPSALDAIIETIAVITWEDLLPLLPDNEDLVHVLSELQQRVTVADTHQPGPPTEPGHDARLRAVLPLAYWNDVPPELSTSEAIGAAVATLDLEQLRRHTMADLVPGLTMLGESPVKRNHAPSLIRLRLLPLLPDTWGEIGQTTIGEILSFEGIGILKIRVLIEHAATQALDVRTTVTPRSLGHTQRSEDAAVDALRTIAAWGNAAGYGTLMNALLGAAMGSNDGPLDALAELDRLDLAAFAGKDRIDAADPMRVAHDILGTLSERDLIIAERRILALDPTSRPTLEAIGDDLGITRQRVFQLEQEIATILHAAVALAMNRPIQRLVQQIRQDLGTACPIDEAPEAVRPNGSHLVDELLTWLAGPFALRDGWFVRHGATIQGLALAAFNAVERNGIAERTAVLDELVLLGVAEAHVERLIVQIDLFDYHEDLVYLPPETIAGRAELQLRLSGRPMTYDELFALDGDVDNFDSFRNAVNASDSFRLLTKSLVGLSEWEGAEYPGVVKAMIAGVEAAGGSVAVDKLAETLEAQFAISKASVSIHSSMNPMFITHDRQVKLRTYSQPYEPDTDLAGRRDCFLINGRWSLRVPIDSDVLRGSGRGIPEAFAVYIGLQPFETVEVGGPARYVHGSWRQTPTIGSIRLNVLDLGLVEGDYVFLRYGVNHAFEFIGLSQDDLAAGDPGLCLRLLTGNTDPADQRPWSEILANSIGRDTTTTLETDDLVQALHERKQTDLLALANELAPNQSLD